MKLIYESKAKVFGIELDRFTPPKEILESGDVNPNNKGFCVSGQDKNCLPSGLLDIKACKGGYKGKYVFYVCYLLCTRAPRSQDRIF